MSGERPDTRLPGFNILKTSVFSAVALLLALLLHAAAARAAFTDLPTAWTNFDNPGFTTDYTYLGQPIADEETSADTSHGSAAVTPAWTDLASGSPNNYPGTYNTPAYGYYDGGTPYDPNNPSTLEDDYVVFRMRIEGNPDGGDAFDSKHWNVLIDVDGDGYKEFWLDLEGSYSSGPGHDRLQVLYDDYNRQDIPDADLARASEFKAYYDETIDLPDSQDTFTRTIFIGDAPPAGDGTGDYWIEIQAPLTAFDDTLGNQIMYPDSPVQFVFSTGASNQNPLQKDWMMDLDFLSLADPITFGDVIKLNGEPTVWLSDERFSAVDFYSIGDNVYTVVNHKPANDDVRTSGTISTAAGSAVVTDPNGTFLTDGLAPGDTFTITTGPDAGDYLIATVDSETQITLTSTLTADATGVSGEYDSGQPVLDTITVTVTDPATGDDEILTLTELSPSSGIFTNSGGVTRPVFSDPANGWVSAVNTSSATVTETWTLTYNGTDWTVVGSESGAQAPAASGTEYTTDGGELTFTVYEDSPAAGDTITFRTLAADPLPTTDDDGDPAAGDDDGSLEVLSGDTIYLFYTASGRTYSDEAGIVGPDQPFIQFTRRSGLAVDTYALAADPADSDLLYVTVTYDCANLNPAAVDLFTVVLTGTFSGGTLDQETVTLVETGADTGVFRSNPGLDSQIDDTVAPPPTPTAEDGLWEDVDAGEVTATYTYGFGSPHPVDPACDGASGTSTATAAFSAIDAGGTVRFTNAAGTRDIESYTSNQPVYIRVDDENLAACGAPPGYVDVLITTGVDTETVRLNETSTSPNSGVFINSATTVGYDLETILGISTVTLPDASGLSIGDSFVIVTGADAGKYTINNINTGVDPDLVTLDRVLTTTATGLTWASPGPVFATYDGAASPDDGIIEAQDAAAITVTYTDCDDGDSDPDNNDKKDAATYSVPSILINEVFFYPDPAADYPEYEFFQLYNSSSSPVNITGYTVKDEDGYSYTVPQLDGSDVVLQPGERMYVFLLDEVFTVNWDYFDGTGAYYFFDDNTPEDQFADPMSGDPADQLTLYDENGVVLDYVAWSSTITPSLDWKSDDNFAVTQSLWADDVYRDVGVSAPPIPAGFSIIRSDDGLSPADGFDTNQPSDWIYTSAAWLFAPGGPVITDVLVSSFDAFVSRGRVVLRWETAAENGTLGFNLLRRDRLRGYVQVNGALLPGLIEAPQGGTYRFGDPGVKPGGTYTYLLEEVEQGGGTSLHGPFTVKAGGGEPGSPPALEYSRSPHQPGTLSEKRRVPRRPGTHRPPSRPGDSLKITVGDTGLYYLDAAAVADGFGIPPARARNLIARYGLALSNAGNEVAWLAARRGAGLYFYGRESTSPYSEHNIYLLAPGAGLPMREVSGRPAAPDVPGLTFTDTLHVEEDLSPAPAFFTDPDADYWLWEYVFGGYPGLDTMSFDFHTDGAVASGTAALYATFVGASSAGSGMHFARLFMNGSEIGTCSFGDTEATACDVTFAQALLAEGVNTLTVVGELPPGMSFSFFYLDSFDVTYERTYAATEGAVAFGTSHHRAVTVTGLPEAAVRLLDVTFPNDPVLVLDGALAGGPSGFSLSFTPLAEDSKCFAAAESAVLEPLAVTPALPGSLRSRKNGADYLVIAPSALAEAAGEYAAYRASRGLRTMVASVEEITDTFGHGVPGPAGIRAFLAYAWESWSAPPRYVLLAGDGSYDYRDVAGQGDNLVPPLMVGTPQGLFASDGALADVDGDGAPEMAVGRIPALSADELRAVLAKTVAYESHGGDWKRRALFLADNPEENADFGADSRYTGSLLPPDLTVDYVNLANVSPAAAAQQVAGAFAAGTAHFNYYGHGGLDRLAQEGIVTTASAPSLAATPAPPLLTAMTCAAGQFAIPGYDSVSETLVLSPEAGATAVWAPTGFSIDDDARTLGAAFYQALFGESGGTVGDAVLAATRSFADSGTGIYLPLIYNLLGDPALQVR